MNKLTKTALFTIGASLLLFCVILASRGDSHKSFVILSTNDIHAQIDKFPQLVTAVEMCRDTTEVILVDAGDRWTGNAFVDLVEFYAPIYELFNSLKYDVAIYGNHEFDKGQAYLAQSNIQAKFPIIGANIVSDTTSFPQPLGHYVVKVKDKNIAFVGVVGNYDANSHPAGKDESYEGLTFTDPHTTASKYNYLSHQCDMLVLVSHSGLERDVEFAQSPLSQGYDYIVSSHSHDVANEFVNGKLVSQTGSRLKNIGATTVTIAKDGQITLSHRNIPLSEYEPDAATASKVAEYYHNPQLTKSIGSVGEPFSKQGVCNLFTSSIAQRVGADIGIYNAGGVRVSAIEKGDISLSTILNAEPFGSYVATASMSVDNLRELVMTKFNDKVNIGEAHSIDLVMTTPYNVITDASGDAVDVIFPELDSKKMYKVAVGDYVYKTYRGLHYKKGVITEIPVAKVLEDYVAAAEVLMPDNEPRQQIIK